MLEDETEKKIKKREGERKKDEQKKAQEGEKITSAKSLILELIRYSQYCNT